MSYDGLPPEVESKGRISFWADWLCEWLCLVDTICLILTFNCWSPHLEERFWKFLRN